MSKGRDDIWTGWVEIDPIALPDDEDEDDAKITHPGGDGVGGSSRPMTAARLHLDIRFAPMERWVGGGRRGSTWGEMALCALHLFAGRSPPWTHHSCSILPVRQSTSA